MQIIQNRRNFLAGLTAAGAAGLMGAATPAVAEPPPETGRIRLSKNSGICLAPQYVAEDLLYAEGFTHVDYVESQPGFGIATDTASGKIDFSMNFIAPALVAVDQGHRLTLMGGIHPGCWELFVQPGIGSILQLKGRKVGVQAIGSAPHLFIVSIAAHVGLDPVRDIVWVSDPEVKPKELFLRGDVDAFLGFPPEPQELRAKAAGDVIINSALDRPWSQYFCCVLAGNPGFIAANPVASKRVMRAILKAADLCVADPAMVARRLVEGKFTANYDYALQALGEVPYKRWRDYDVEDTVRFYALRLHEAGAITASPQEIIAKATDWRFLNELRRELKS
ncbi:ABC transporter substrate-binding protein [Rhizobium sp. 1399]|uniref:ABC transporter substrate-binding protein n=1 Tax=Rhizobium sp. 1399 TaxID=2817758 RepID=UPI00285FFF0B|nr:ABC transporter substrate-binding protein [Rhizobium sp. 1399]MDR6667949.1 NitT/TauT family transport system substrate-binding protein [Rhizobium sp. 1399]